MSKYEGYIAERLGLPGLKPHGYKECTIYQFWIATVHYADTTLIVAIIDTEEGTKGFVGRLISETDIPSITCNQLDMDIPANKILSNLNVLSEDKGYFTDTLPFNYKMEIRNWRSHCIFKGTAHTTNLSQKKLAHSLIQTAHLIAEEAGDETFLSFMEELPKFDLE